MSNIIFDHAHKQCPLKSYNALAKHGLLVDPNKITQHPPKDICRFVHLRNGYLEFIEDRSFFGPLKRFLGITMPGFCLALEDDGDLEAFSKTERLQQFEPYTYRRPYDWKSGKTGPGWTFLKFKKPIISGVNLWLIHYDKVESGAKKSQKNDAFVTEVTFLYKTKADIENFEALTGVVSKDDVVHFDNINFRFKKWDFQKRTTIQSITVAHVDVTEKINISDRVYWDLNIIPK